MGRELRALLAWCALGSCVGKLPDVGKNMTQIVTERGFGIDSHWVTTVDGYVLQMFRLRLPHEDPDATRKPVVLLGHCLLCSSFDFVNNFRNQSLAFMLADAGFDVWLGNNRGNTYSTNHTTLSTDSAEFWDFTYDEMALYDLPAMVDYTIRTTGAPQITYAGHSEGTLQAFAGFGLNQTLAGQVNLFVALAPVAFVNHMKSPIFLALRDLDVADILKLFGVKKFLTSKGLLDKLSPGICNLIPRGCDDAIFLFCGPTKHINATRLQVYVSQTPAGTSVKNMIHWSQGAHKHTPFQMYDYLTRAANRAHYNQSHPPLYNLSAVTVPTALFTGQGDYLADPLDVAQLIAALPSKTVIYHNDQPTYAHLDFAWGEDANLSIYLDVIRLIKQQVQKGPA